MQDIDLSPQLRDLIRTSESDGLVVLITMRGFKSTEDSNVSLKVRNSIYTLVFNKSLSCYLSSKEYFYIIYLCCIKALIVLNARYDKAVSESLNN
ncbi:hypothetical protein O181_066337 [Austropuccinia psidii MF-1]|uniref:Uncharacterized protein n=1 Tax=Austropuccinia psidii MF-1 TaxID=1389203 RepID=A0A9Q3EYZ1_9BASI|nr:hypothetical protein [Austropuccinia psidii MF-1]